MENSSLIEYIEQLRQKGKTNEEIKVELSISGFDIKDISQALSYLDKETALKEITDKNKNKNGLVGKVVYIILILLLLSAISYVLIYGNPCLDIMVCKSELINYIKNLL